MKILFVAFTFSLCMQLIGQQKNVANMQNFNPRFEVFKLPGDIQGRQGTGLGLSLSYDIMNAHSRKLKVETREGEGSTFIIHFTER